MELILVLMLAFGMWRASGDIVWAGMLCFGLWSIWVGLCKDEPEERE